MKTPRLGNAVRRLSSAANINATEYEFEIGTRSMT
jgi:hypothetical protein